MSYYDETGRSWKLGARIGAGGEGEVFRLEDAPAYCAKIYAQRPVPDAKVRKLRTLRALAERLQGVAALPVSLLFAKPAQKQPAGVVLPFVEGRDIHDLYNPEARQQTFPRADLGFLVAAARNVAFVFGRAHQAGIVIGDVSEQNLKVRADATVTLIDCDSVQLSDAAEFFPCEVGTPMWTPAELQSRSLSGIQRTANHDGFGLAQMIFLLLFGGRYPYAGVPLPGVDLRPEEAVARFAFAYDPTPAKPLLSPPPHALRFSAYPKEVQELFLRAFRKGSEKNGARPSPAEWIATLTQLGETLKQCPASRAHSFWPGNPHCPWCEMAQRSGVDLFPSIDGASGVGLWPPDAFQLELTAFRPVPEQALEKGRAIAGVKPGGGLGWITAGLQKIETLRRFLNGRELADLRQELERVEKKIQGMGWKLRELVQQHQRDLDTARREASAFASSLQNRMLLEREVYAEVVKKVQASALEDYLRDAEVHTAEIRGIGRQRIETLMAHGIETAADITQERLSRAHSFGPKLIARLLQWRREIEKEFQSFGNQTHQRAIQAGMPEALRRRSDQLKARIREILIKTDASKRTYAKAFQKLEESFHQQQIQREVLQMQIAALQ